MSKTNLVQKNRRRQKRGLKPHKGQQRPSMVVAALKAIANCPSTPTLIAQCQQRTLKAYRSKTSAYQRMTIEPN